MKKFLVGWGLYLLAKWRVFQVVIKHVIKYIFTILFIYFLSYGIACVADEKYPHEVLSGTDIVDINNYKTNMDVKFGNYIAETGGAILTLLIEKQGKSIDLHRVFSEPGMDNKKKHYKGLIKFSDGSFKSRNIVLRFINGGGVLVLERASGTDEIPDNIWVHYTPRQSGENK